MLAWEMGSRWDRIPSRASEQRLPHDTTPHAACLLVDVHVELLVARRDAGSLTVLLCALARTVAACALLGPCDERQSYTEYSAVQSLYLACTLYYSCRLYYTVRYTA